jgi:hypothetical protein
MANDEKSADEHEDEKDSSAEDGDEADAPSKPPPSEPPPPKETAKKPAPKPSSERFVSPEGTAPTASLPPAAGLGKSVTVFFVVMLALAAGFWVLASFENPFGGGAPKWKVGQTATVELTLDPADDMKLSCASDTEIGGKRCEYESKSKRHEKKLEDGALLRPYSLADGSARLLAAGVWSAPEVEKSVRPKDRFTLKCQFKIEGKVTAPAVRWDVSGAWNEKAEDWFAGSVSDCKLVK